MTILYQLFPAFIAFIAPLFLAAAGGCFSKKAGMMNYGLEGFMVLGASSSAVAMYLAGGRSYGALAAIGYITAVLVSLVLGIALCFLTRNSKGDRLNAGVVFTLFAYLVNICLFPLITGASSVALPHKEYTASITDLLPPLASSICYGALGTYLLFVLVRVFFRYVPFLKRPYEWFKRVFSAKLVGAFSLLCLVLSLALSLIVNNIIFILIFLCFSMMAVSYIVYRWEEPRKEGKPEGRKLLTSAGGSLVLSGLAFSLIMGGYGDALRMTILDNVLLSSVLAFGLVLLSALLCYKTELGEKKSFAFLLSASLAGLAGAIFMNAVNGAFNVYEGVKGIGLLAIVVVMFGSYRLLGSLWSASFFALCYAVLAESGKLPFLSGINSTYLLVLLYASVFVIGLFALKKRKTE